MIGQNAVCLLQTPQQFLSQDLDSLPTFQDVFDLFILLFFPFSLSIIVAPLVGTVSLFGGTLGSLFLIGWKAE